MGSIQTNLCNLGTTEVKTVKINSIKNKFITFGGQNVLGAIPSTQDIKMVLEKHNAIV